MTGYDYTMNLIIQSECYRELLASQTVVRGVEGDAPEAEWVDGKMYEQVSWFG